jgi:hypothetical protein
MIGIFSCIILTALSVNGMNIATGEGMILEPLKKFLHSKIGNKKIYKPLIGCVKCMSSIYGAAICLLLLPFTIQLIYIIPIVILSSSTVATIIHSQYI